MVKRKVHLAANTLHYVVLLTGSLRLPVMYKNNSRKNPQPQLATDVLMSFQRRTNAAVFNLFAAFILLANQGPA
jgi:hypothetical protein